MTAEATGPSRKILVGFGLVLVAGAALTLLVPSRLLEGGTPAPAFELERLADGRQVSLAELQGKVVVDFWSSTCPPCIRQMRDLESLHVSYHERDVVVLGINTEGSPPAFLRDFLQQRGGVHYDVLINGAAVSEAYQVDALPTLYVIDQQGTIRWSRVGYTPLREIEDTVAELL